MGKVIFILLFVLTSGITWASKCDNPLVKEDLCFKMRHLRSQVMALGAQRELLQVNYFYLTSIGQEIFDLTSSIDAGSISELGHSEGLEALKSGSESLIQHATAQDPIALAAANTLQKKCASCHAQTGPGGGHSWDKIFKHDWDLVVQNCNKEGRNPYVCKSMNGLLSAYAGVLTGPNANRRNFESLRLSAEEIARIALDLQSKHMLHGSEELLKDVQTSAIQTAQLALEKNEAAFSTAEKITSGCMECHARAILPLSGLDLGLKQLSL